MSPMSGCKRLVVVTEAKLDNGDIRVYQACCDVDKKDTAYNPKDFLFIGYGIIYSVDGTVQFGQSDIRRAFFKQIF